MLHPHVRTVEEFVEWEERQDAKYEFADGRISAFPGGTNRHGTIVVNLVSMLHAALGAGRVQSTELKLLTAASSRYADVSVGFDPRDGVERTYQQHPTLLIEVLSKSTHAIDRGAKFDEYRTIETLKEYVLVDSRKRWVQSLRRSGDQWIVALPVCEGAVRFESVELDVTLDELYAGTEL